MADYEIGLLDNATDSFVTGVELYLDPKNPMGWKYALLLIGQALELFLKVRLAQLDPSAVFEDPRKQKQGARTVGYKGAIRRLNEHGVILSRDALRNIARVRRVRNNVEHFEIRIARAEVDQYAASAMRFLDDFLYEELGLNVIDLFESRTTFQEFKERTKSTQEQNDEAERRARDELPIRPKETYFWEIVHCPECLTESVPIKERIGPARCFRCKAEWEQVDECVRCAGVALVQEGDEYPYFCDACTLWS